MHKVKTDSMTQKTSKSSQASTSDQPEDILIQKLQNRAKEEEIDALILLGYLYKQGGEVPKSIEKACHYFMQAAEKDNRHALYLLGLCYEDEEYSNFSLLTAFEFFKKAAGRGHIDAIIRVADSYRFGKGVEASESEAFKFYKKAADLGNDHCQIIVADCYAKGVGVDQNEHIASDYYKLAAAQGNIFAKMVIESYDEKWLLEKHSFRETIEHFHSLAQNGEIKAGIHLDSVLNDFNIEEIVQDNQLFDSLRKIAEAGNPYAQRILGSCYWTGLGPPKSLNEAFKWWEQAVKNGDVRSYGYLAFFILMTRQSNDFLQKAESFLTTEILEKDIWARFLFKQMKAKGSNEKEKLDPIVWNNNLTIKDEEVFLKQFDTWIKKHYFSVHVSTLLKKRHAKLKKR